MSPPLRLARLVLDVVDMDRAIAFWTAALGYHVHSRDETFVVLKDLENKPDHLPLALQPTDTPKRARTVDDAAPLHLELFTDDMEREARRLESLGAHRVKDWPYGDDKPNWIVLRCHEGHEICIVQR